MKASQQKKSLNAPKPIKLKFENISSVKSQEGIKEDESGSSNTIVDAHGIAWMEKCLEEVERTGRTLSHENVGVCLDVIRKLKRLVDSQLMDSSKLKFRIVKSAKKFTKPDQVSTKSPSPQPNMPNISSISESNPSTLADSIVDKGIPLNVTTPIKIKIKKLQSRTQNIENSNPSLNGTVGEIKSVSNEEVIRKMRLQMKRLMGNYEEKCRVEGELRGQLATVEKELRRAKSRELESQNVIQPVAIDLKFSLKVIESKPEPVEQILVNHQPYIPPAVPSPTPSMPSPGYSAETISHLQMIIVSQNKQIEALRQKISKR